MEAVTQILTAFSNKYNLPQLTLETGVKALENWMKDNPEEHNQLFPGLTSSNFIFLNLSQHLVFFKHEHETFVVRTKYSLFTDRQKDLEVGWYALDVNENGEVIDDWLVFE